MNVLLAGGAGFLGKNFAIYWRARHPDSDVVVVDTLRRHRSDVGLLEDIGNVTIVEADVTNTDFVVRTLSAASIDVLVNFACDPSVDRATADPQAAVRSNLTSVVSLLEACRQVPGLRFHHVSSAEVFSGRARRAPVDENAAYAPRNAYGATKAGADHFVRVYQQCFGVAATISIAPNTYGPYQRLDQAVPRFVTNALLGVPLPILGGGQCLREWLHVRDHCAGLAAVIERGEPGRTYNLGSGELCTAASLAEAVLRTAGRPRSLIERLPDRPGHSSRPALNSSLAYRELGWRASTSLEVGLQETANWYASNRQWWMPSDETAVSDGEKYQGAG